MIANYFSRVRLQARWALWFALINALVAGLISMRLLAPTDFNANPVSMAFVASNWVAHFSTLGFATWLVVLLPLAILLPLAGVYRAIALLLFFIVQFLLLIDTFVYLQYRFHINGFIVDLILNDSEGQIFSFSAMAWAMATAMALLLLAAEVVIARWLWGKVSRVAKFRFSRRFALFCMVVTLASHLVHIWADANAYQPITGYSKLLPLAHSTTSYRMMEKNGWADPEAYNNRSMLKNASGNNGLHYPQASLQCERADKPLNILLIAIDSWRADTLTAESAPNMNAFAASSSRFNQHFSGSNSTRAGIFSLFYGLPGQYWQTMKDSQTAPVLMQELIRQQYQMGIFSSAKLDSPRFNQTVFQPIENLRNGSPGKAPYQRDAKLTQDWQQWFDNDRDQSKPFFGFLFYDSPHGVSFPDNYPKPFLPSWENVNQMLLNDSFDAVPYLNRYKNSVHYTDSLVGGVLKNLEQSGHLDDTVVLITGDHGEEFNDNGKGFWGHNGNFSRVQVQVPLVVHWPGKEPNKVFDQWTSHYDLPPTLMNRVLGCSNPATDYSIGGDLYRSDAGQGWLLAASYSRYAIIEPERITEIDPLGNYKIYNHDYSLLAEGDLNHSVMLKAVNEISRFYRR
ncbi:MAG: DUF3413 domain-containing protein [Halopseudomonas sp.]